MERQQDGEGPTAQESLDALAQTAALNARRLKRPRRYWISVAFMMTVFPLLPLAVGLPPLIRFIVPPVLIAVVAAFAAWKQPTAVRKIRLRGLRTLPLIGLVLLAVVLAMLNMYVYSATQWWGVPLASAALMFAIVAVGGPAIDRGWARTASYRDE